MAQGRGSATTRCLAVGGLLAACLLLGAADAATHSVVWSFNADTWPRGKSFRAGDVLGECPTVQANPNLKLLPHHPRQVGEW